MSLPSTSSTSPITISSHTWSVLGGGGERNKDGMGEAQFSSKLNSLGQTYFAICSLSLGQLQNVRVTVFPGMPWLSLPGCKT